MTARFRIPFMTAALLGLATLGAGRTAEASLTLTISVYSEGGGDLKGEVDIIVTTPNSDQAPTLVPAVSPGSAYLSSQGGVATLSYTGTLGGVNFNFATQAVTNEPGSSASAFLNLGSSNITNEAGEDRLIVITANADGYTLPATAPLRHFLSAIVNGQTGTFTGGDATAQGTFEATNILDAIQTKQLSVTGSSVASDPGNTNPSTILTNPDVPYTMTTQFQGTLLAGAQLAGITVSHQITAVPEPTNIALAGVGVVLSLGALRRRGRA